jgi:hypothetical protein
LEATPDGRFYVSRDREIPGWRRAITDRGVPIMTAIEELHHQ